MPGTVFDYDMAVLLTERKHVNQEGAGDCGAAKRFHSVAGHIDQGVVLMRFRRIAICNLQYDRARLPAQATRSAPRLMYLMTARNEKLTF